jgi:D-hexose-6-phosphate mutarotase
MNDSAISELLRKHEIPGRVTLATGNGGLPKLEIKTDRSTAEIYPHGAHVTDFQKNGEPPLLFMSQASQFVDGKPIRGGVPIVFPWFGPREGVPAHGFARLVSWDLRAASLTPSGAVKLSFDLPESAAKSYDVNARVSHVVTVDDQLTMELIVTNTAASGNFVFENCFHTYFAVSGIDAVSITGLKGAPYLDRLDSTALKSESADAIRIRSEVDRTYVNAAGPVEIQDATLRRVIRVEKSGSASTVVWNPWVAKAKAMADFGDEEFRQMVCVESGNVAQNKIALAPGGIASLKVVVSSRPT